ncbi:hypothetical protein JG687_00004442 [Phytophthora cactorum]|nr:hypothetical protein JG687_00004442 [Phytophthora cactorum]
MSTVGYGDMTPVTWFGKVVGCCTVLTGMLVLALPITVIGTNFQKVMKSVMHETMKSNVDYLKGKRMLCRNEIEAILERFHAVTEGIHLDIDDVINVYDTDNSGMLEDDELANTSHLIMPDNELLLRLLDMQESFQERLIETEQRLEAKMNNLTKILMRLEGMMELDD